jgi:cellulose synthase/poly-beta-1,6-N-acetylglucosamine synthase-like glycosyltransferase
MTERKRSRNKFGMTTNMKFNKLSIVIPVYNEEKTIEGILARVEAVDPVRSDASNGVDDSFG